MKNLALTLLCFNVICVSGQFSAPDEVLQYFDNTLPSRIYAPDINQDGDKDIICFSQDYFDGFTTILYFENTGTGSFMKPEAFFYGFSLDYDIIRSDFEFFDITGDGISEILFVGSSGISYGDFMVGDAYGLQTILFPPELQVGSDFSYYLDKRFYDCDQDGDQDVLVIDQTTNEIVWLINDGTWNFYETISTNLNTYNYLDFITLEFDFNGDGLPDGFDDNQLVENVDYFNFVYHQFESNTNIISTPDMDGDGDPDILAMVGLGLYWYEQTSPFVFSIQHALVEDLPSYPNVVAWDFDNDGVVELFINTNLLDGDGSSYTYLENDGFGNFSEIVTDVFAPGFNLYSNPVDFNSDGQYEVLSYLDYYQTQLGDLNIQSLIEVLSLGNNASLIEREVVDSFIDAVLLFDGQEVNEDGSTVFTAICKSDFAVWDYFDLRNVSFVRTPEGNNINFIYGDILLRGIYFETLSLGPNESGFQDFVLSYQDYESGLTSVVFLEYNTTLSQYVISMEFDLGLVMVSDLYYDDMNGDGIKDVVCILAPGDVDIAVLLANGTGSFDLDYIAWDDFLLPKNMLDMNSDGLLDMIYSDEVSLWYSINTGTLNFTQAHLIGPDFYTVYNNEDVNYDGRQDILVKTNYDLRWLLQNESGAFNTNEYMNAELEGLYPYVKLHRDFDADGIDEYLITTSSGPYYYDVNNPENNGIVEIGNGALESLSTNDVDGDGALDLIGSNDFYGDYVYAYWQKNSLHESCNDPSSCNYDPLADNNLACEYGICGCTNILACNYDPGATVDNGSCILGGCTNPEACNYDVDAICDDGSCIIGDEVIVHITPIDMGYPFNWAEIVVYDELIPSEDIDVISMYSGEEIVHSIGCRSANCFNLAFKQSFYFVESAQMDIFIETASGLILLDDTVSMIDLSHLPINVDGEFQLNYLQDYGAVVDGFCLCPQDALVGCTYEGAVNYSEYAECNDGSCIYGLSGIVFNDLNANGIMEDDEYGLPFEHVLIEPGGIEAITDNYGHFFVPLENGSYTVQLIQNPNFPYITTQQTQVVDVLPSSGSVQDISFGESMSIPISTMCVDFYPNFLSYVCNAYVNFNICYRNMGNVPLDGIIRLEIDPLFTAWNEITPIDSVVGNYIYMSYSNLMPGEMFFYDIELLTPSTDYIGTTLVNTAIVSGFYNGVEIAAGIKVREFEHACSFDPNDKQPDPIGFTQDHFIRDDSRVEFLIRFQNTGNAPALNVVIKDTIDSNFDLETFQLVANSHNVMTIVDPNTREVTFYFLEIFLPDSVHDEPGSHGLVSYYLTPMSGLDHGTVLQNSASIYFDNNLPVVTNTTDHTIFDCTQYQAQADTNYGGTCYAPLWEAVPNVLWTDQYNWYVDGVLSSNEESFSLSSSGAHEIVLEIDNALCSSQDVTYLVNLDETLQASILPHASSFCEGESILLESANTTGNVWYLNGDEVGNNDQLEVSEAGVYSLVVDVNGCILAPVFAEISEMNGPEVGSINQVQNDLIVLNNVEYVYQWYAENEIIPEANSFLYQIQSSGFYSVLVTSENGCTSIQNIEALYTETSEVAQTSLRLFPNPSSGVVVLQGLQVNANVRVYDALGHLVFRSDNPITNQFDLKYLADGMYTFQIMSDETMTNFQLMIQK